MALKAMGFVKTARYTADDGMIFELDITHLEDPFQTQAGEFHSELAPSASAAQMNAAIVAYVKSFAESAWTVEFGLLDGVKLIIAVDGLLS
jgi:hypothetical protein